MRFPRECIRCPVEASFRSVALGVSSTEKQVELPREHVPPAWISRQVLLCQGRVYVGRGFGHREAQKTEVAGLRSLSPGGPPGLSEVGRRELPEQCLRVGLHCEIPREVCSRGKMSVTLR